MHIMEEMDPASILFSLRIARTWLYSAEYEEVVCIFNFFFQIVGGGGGGGEMGWGLAMCDVLVIEFSY